MNTKKNSTRKLVMAALMAAMTCVCTMVIKIPIPATGGYVNLGDSAVLLCSWYVGGIYGVAAAAIGSMLADILLGVMNYAAATLVIKGLMAFAAWKLFDRMSNHKGQYIGAVAAALIMTLGYFIYEFAFLGYGMVAVTTIPFSLIQGFCGAVVGVFLSRVMEKNTYLRNMLHSKNL